MKELEGYTKKIIEYLTEEELRELLENIDKTTKIGRRDLVILSLLYDTAARASEIINLKLENIHLEEKYIILDGKGSRQRVVPLMENTVNLLKQYLKENTLNVYLFENKNNKLLNKNILADVLSKYTKTFNKKITPHTFRHSRAIHLLSVGVPLIMIRDLLGHESVITTEEYAKVLEKNKFEVIENASKDINNKLDDWNDDKDLLSQLLSL